MQRKVCRQLRDSDYVDNTSRILVTQVLNRKSNCMVPSSDESIHESLDLT